MMRAWFLMVIGLASGMSFAQNLQCQQNFEAIQNDIAMIMEATKQENYDVVLDKTYPSLIKIAGGEEAYQQLVAKNNLTFKQQGFVLGKIKNDLPVDNFVIGDEEICLIPTRLSLKSSTKQAVVKSYMIAIRQESSQEWKYLNGVNMKQKFALLTLLPNWPDEIELPESTVEMEEKTVN